MRCVLRQLTANVDLQLTEVHDVSHRKLHDDVSVRRQAACTLQGDCSSNGSWVLTADSVVPQSRCRDVGRNIGQPDDEIVRSFSLTKINITSMHVYTTEE